MHVSQESEFTSLSIASGHSRLARNWESTGTTRFPKVARHRSLRSGSTRWCVDKSDMSDRRHLKGALRLGVFLGVAFGAVNLVFRWLFPVSDDTVGALLPVYVPMFSLWAFAAFRAARRDRQLLSGVATGVVVAFATFCVFDVLNL